MYTNRDLHINRTFAEPFIDFNQWRRGDKKITTKHCFYFNLHLFPLNRLVFISPKKKPSSDLNNTLTLFNWFFFVWKIFAWNSKIYFFIICYSILINCNICPKVVNAFRNNQKQTFSLKKFGNWHFLKWTKNVLNFSFFRKKKRICNLHLNCRLDLRSILMNQ